MASPKQYQQAYTAYIAAHESFNISQIKQQIPNFNFQGIGDLERQFIEKLNSGVGKSQSVVDLENAINTIKNILDDGKDRVKNLQDLSSALKEMDSQILILQAKLKGDSNLQSILNTYEMWKQRVQKLQKFSNQLGSKNSDGQPLKIYFGDDNSPNFLYTKESKIKGHSTYVSVAAIRNAAYGLLRKQLGLLSESVVWAIIVSTAGAAALSATEEMAKQIKTKAEGVRSTQTLKSGIQTIIKADLEKIVKDKQQLKEIQKKAFQIVGNTPLVDVGGQISANGGTIDLKITLKNIKENAGSDYVGTPLLRTQNRRLIIYAANAISSGDLDGALTYWALLRAMGSNEYQRDLSPLKKALINHLGTEIAFGSGEDKANYMGINGKYIHITNWLQAIQDNPHKYLFIQNQSSSYVNDGKDRSSELLSVKNRVPAEDLLKVLTTEVFFMQKHLQL